MSQAAWPAPQEASKASGRANIAAAVAAMDEKAEWVDVTDSSAWRHPHGREGDFRPERSRASRKYFDEVQASNRTSSSTRGESSIVPHAARGCAKDPGARDAAYVQLLRMRGRLKTVRGELIRATALRRSRAGGPAGPLDGHAGWRVRQGRRLPGGSRTKQSARARDESGGYKVPRHGHGKPQAPFSGKPAEETVERGHAHALPAVAAEERDCDWTPTRPVGGLVGSAISRGLVIAPLGVLARCARQALRRVLGTASEIDRADEWFNGRGSNLRRAHLAREDSTTYCVAIIQPADAPGRRDDRGAACVAAGCALRGRTGAIGSSGAKRVVATCRTCPRR